MLVQLQEEPLSPTIVLGRAGGELLEEEEEEEEEE